VVTVPTEARANWVLEKAKARPCAPFVWVAVASELSEATMDAPIWRRPDGTRSGFSPGSRKRGGVMGGLSVIIGLTILGLGFIFLP
jgi:hypothetical protein